MYIFSILKMLVISLMLCKSYALAYSNDSKLHYTYMTAEFGMSRVSYYIMEASSADMQLRPNCILLIMCSTMSKLVNILLLLSQKTALTFGL